MSEFWKQKCRNNSRKDVPYFLSDSGPTGKMTSQMWAVYRINEFGCAAFKMLQPNVKRDGGGDAGGGRGERKSVFLFKDMLGIPSKLPEKSERNLGVDDVDLKAQFLS